MRSHRLFALLAIDEANFDDPVKVVVAGDSTETWSTRNCQDMAHMLDGCRPKAFPESLIPIQTNINEFAEELPGSTRLMVVGLFDDDSLYASHLGADCFQGAIRPLEAAALGTALKVAIGVAAPVGIEDRGKAAA